MPTDAGAAALASEIARAALRLSKVQIATLTAAMRNGASPAQAFASARQNLGSRAFEDGVASLESACRAASPVAAETIALALEAALRARDATSSLPILVWSGPLPGSASFFTTTGTLFGIVGNARERLLLVTFSAYPIVGLVEALLEASNRGVSIRFVLESQSQSGGRLAVDAAAAFAPLREHAEFFVWPLQHRTPGALLHAKTVVADREIALITSANLTENGIDANLELGVRVESASLASEIERHIDALICAGTLVQT